MIIKNSPGGTPKAAWPDLVEELDRWRDTGRSATMWWRDDDAVTATPRLGDLLSLADGIPLALAVIPASADPALAAALAAWPDIAVVQHGWRHANHGGDGKKCEFPERRRPRDTAIELTAGRARRAASRCRRWRRGRCAGCRYRCRGSTCTSMSSRGTPQAGLLETVRRSAG